MLSQPILYLLKAEHLPHSIMQIRQEIPRSTQNALCIASYISPDTSNINAYKYVKAAIDTIAFTPPLTSYTPEEIANLPVDRYEEHDTFFNVVRVFGDPINTFIYSILQAYQILLEDVLVTGTTLSHYEWHMLRGSFGDMLDYLYHPTNNTSDEFDVAFDIPPIEHTYTPLGRWKRGHQVFFILIQSLIVVLKCMKDVLETGNALYGEITLEIMTNLMLGSAASLRFAGDFLPTEYEQIVRPTMMPPHLKSGFSGLQVRDHRYMLKTLQELKEPMVQSKELYQDHYHHFLQALEETYNAHKFVCESFNGKKEKSLRASNTTEKTAFDVLDQFRKNRLKRAKLR